MRVQIIKMINIMNEKNKHSKSNNNNYIKENEYKYFSITKVIVIY